jgi:hypothetical protein
MTLTLFVTLACTSGLHAHAAYVSGQFEDARERETKKPLDAASEYTCAESAPALVLSLREARLCKLKSAPAHPTHTPLHELFIESDAPDDEVLLDSFERDPRAFPALTQLSFAAPAERPLRVLQTQLERPPRV